MNKTVAIVGSHPRTKELAPFADEKVDIWVFNEVVGKKQVPRADAVFQMHRPPIWKNPNNRNDPNHYQWLQSQNDVDVYMLDQYPDVPRCVKYPYAEICNTLLTDFIQQGGDPIRYFTSSINYAQALAIYKGYERIELYGVEMETNTEYSYQRDGVYFWMGLAIGRGIQVQICRDSQLFRSPLYGYEGDITLNPGEFGKRLVELQPQEKPMLDAMEKARLAQDEALKAAAEHPDQKDEQTKAFFKAIKQQANAVIQYGALRGIIEENTRYKAKAETMLSGPAGEVLFSRQEFEQSAAKAQEKQEQYESLMHTNGAAATQAWNELGTLANASQKARNRQTSIYLMAHEKYMQAALEFGRFTGIFNENLRYMQIVDELVRMAGGQKSEEAMLAMREAVNA